MTLYSFKELKDFVEIKLGIDTSRSKSSFETIRETLSQQELGQNVEFTSSDIFFTDEKGKKHKGFLYIPMNKYNQIKFAEKGWNTMPRFHILNCNTIQKQRRKSNFNGHYVFSNETIIEKDIDEEEKELILCGYCRKEQSISYENEVYL